MCRREKDGGPCSTRGNKRRMLRRCQYHQWVVGLDHDAELLEWEVVGTDYDTRRSFSAVAYV